MAGFVDVLGGQPHIGGASFFRLGISLVVRLLSDFATILCRVVFVGQTTLCRRLDFQSVGLRAVCLGKPVASKTHRKNFCGSRLILPFGQWLMVALITLGREKPESVWPCAGGRAT
ncbi:hypothetical protein [Allomesorhizobium camelthorni]|uniref:Uncharacterized protein n=1 Tax=Allomesorhizobium camelthorni TaxID=475069 RepID=A0A6G4WJ47_9HYPH|nr:hypothetical protein [Mesorhizobium camelthorni]NGO54629.1 hypothetical protein [Mesorhizobium camelthorni]